MARVSHGDTGSGGVVPGVVGYGGMVRTLVLPRGTGPGVHFPLYPHCIPTGDHFGHFFDQFSTILDTFSTSFDPFWPDFGLILVRKVPKMTKFSWKSDNFHENPSFYPFSVSIGQFCQNSFQPLSNPRGFCQNDTFWHHWHHCFPCFAVARVAQTPIQSQRKSAILEKMTKITKNSDFPHFSKTPLFGTSQDPSQFCQNRQKQSKRPVFKAGCGQNWRKSLFLLFLLFLDPFWTHFSTIFMKI